VNLHLTGTFRRSVDEKHRVAIPKRLRTTLVEASTAEAVTVEKSPSKPSSKSSTKPSKETATVHLYVAPGTDGSLAIYSESAFSRLAEKLAAGSPAGPHNRAFSRLFFARAQRVEMDSQGRIRIAPELIGLAELKDEAVMVGVGDRIELWNVEEWEKYSQQQQPHYDELAERAFDQQP